MKRFVVLSDSHGRSQRELERLKPLMLESDYIVHLGDGSADLRKFSEEYPEKTYICRGNCDFSFGREEYVLEAEGISILCCHGHRYGVKSGLSLLAARAKELHCAAALYGHTHEADIREADGVLCVNPGALSSYFAPSYCYLVVHEGKTTPTIVNL